jgi:hypothetical protein
MKHQKLHEKAAAIKSVLLAESILDWLVDALVGPYLQSKADELKNDPEWKRLQKEMKELQAKSEKLKKRAEQLAKKAEVDEKNRKKIDNRHIKSTARTKPL